MGVNGEETRDEQQHRDQDQQDRDDAVQRFGFQSSGPVSSDPRADKAAGQKVQDNEPLGPKASDGMPMRADRQDRYDGFNVPTWLTAPSVLCLLPTLER